MVDNQGSSYTVRLMLFVIGYFLTFVAAASILIWLFPAYTVWIAVTAGYLFVAFAALKVGLEWDLAGTPTEGRTQAKSFPIVMLVILISTQVVPDLIHSRQPDWTAFFIVIFFFAAAIYPPFFLGRYINRRRTSQSPNT